MGRVSYRTFEGKYRSRIRRGGRQDEGLPWEFHAYEVHELGGGSCGRPSWSMSASQEQRVRHAESTRTWNTRAWAKTGPDAWRRADIGSRSSGIPVLAVNKPRPNSTSACSRAGSHDDPDPAQDPRTGGAEPRLSLLSFGSALHALRAAPQAGQRRTHEKLGGSFLESLDSPFRLGAEPPAAYPAQAPLRRGRGAHGFPAGKLLTERELDGTAGSTARYACRYEIFTPDHLLNQSPQVLQQPAASADAGSQQPRAY